MKILKNKEKLLYALEKERIAGRTLSGEDAAARLGISRVAVWKAVEALRTEGYAIEALPAKGYRLLDCDILSSPRVRAYLPPRLENLKIFCYDTVDSTNKQAKILAGGDFSGSALFAANAQSEGRGRLGRTFYSPPNTGLYLSFLFSSRESLEVLSGVTPYTAVAASRILEKSISQKIGIKWVNDLYLDGKKICGILTEVLTGFDGECENKIIVGVGINLTTENFPGDLSERAGAVGKGINRAELAADIASALSFFIQDPQNRDWINEYSERSIVMGKKVVLDKWGETFEGTVVGFDRNGGLLLDMGEESPRLFTGGEISLRLCQKTSEKRA